jgi:hypothetical protein
MVYGERLEIGASGGLSVVPLDSLSDVRVSGQSVTTGGGFFGGGFGAKGAAEGMLISTVLNGLTTKKTKWVTIGIVADGGWVDLRLANYGVLPVRSAVRVLADAVSDRRSVEVPSPPPPGPDSEEDLVSKLERLTTLRESGALSDEEFIAAKIRLLKA